MAVNIVTINCPQCGAPIDIEEGRTSIFCSYCGSRVSVEDNNDLIYRIIKEKNNVQAKNEARNLEVEREIKLKQLEIYQKKEKSKTVLKVFATMLLGTMGICSLEDPLFGPNYLTSFVSFAVCFLIWRPSRSKEPSIKDERVRFPSGAFYYTGRPYSEIVSIIKSAGFTNITLVPLNDLTEWKKRKSGLVENVLINGQPLTNGYAKYYKDDKIVISYHCPRYNYD